MQKMRDYEFADLEGNQVDALKKLERDLNQHSEDGGGEIVVIAYQASPKAGTTSPNSKL